MKTYRQLFEQYGYFESPALSLKLDGLELQGQEDFFLCDTELTLSNTPCANLLTARLCGIEKKEKLYKALQLGARVELKLGYQKQLTPLFTGCLYSIDAQSDGGAPPALQLYALDCKGLMMLGARAAYPPNKKLSQLIREVLRQPHYAALASKSKISFIDGALDVPVPFEEMSDYAFLSFWAQQLGYEFYFLADTAYFVRVRDNPTPLLSLCTGDGLLSLRAHATLAGQTAACTVSGYDGMGRRVEATAKPVRAKSFGGQKLNSVIKNTHSLLLPEVETAAQARLLAKARMDESMRTQCTVEGTSVGLPDLVPSRVIQIEEATGLLDGSYYLTQVRHSVGADGFTSTFEAYAV